MLELTEDPEITDPNVRMVVTNTPTEGIGSVEAPRGTLTHHYKTDENGILTDVNLIVGTTNNNAPIAMSIKKAAEGLIKGGEVSEGLLIRSRWLSEITILACLARLILCRDKCRLRSKSKMHTVLVHDLIMV